MMEGENGSHQAVLRSPHSAHAQGINEKMFILIEDDKGGE